MSDVSTLLADHVTFRCSSLDRIAVAGYIPGLMCEGGVVRFLLKRGNPVPSPVLLARNRDRMVADLDAVVAARDLPVVRFGRRESKEEVARPHLARARAEGRTGVVLIGKSQERTSVWRGFEDKASGLAGPRHPHFSYRRQAGVPDHWYFYIWDGEWGPVLVKLCPYAPYPMWVNVNGHEWVKAHLDAAGVGYQSIDNGLAASPRPRPGAASVRPAVGSRSACWARALAVVVTQSPHRPRSGCGVWLGLLTAPGGGLRHRQL